MKEMNSSYEESAILRVGEVFGVDGRKVIIKVDKNKNASDLLFNGDLIKNVSVGSYLEIRKGFLCLIGKIDGETIKEETLLIRDNDNRVREKLKFTRFINLSLVGYLSYDGEFNRGIKELPLIGNEAFILTAQKIRSVHKLNNKDTSYYIKIAETENEGIPIDLPINGLFNSHIAIFGNTGSGKSNTLVSLYKNLIEVLESEPGFRNNCRILIFDFNGEFINRKCITTEKNVYNLRTKDNSGNRIPIKFDELFDYETMSILVEATELTQKPFLKRSINFYKRARNKQDYDAYLRAIVKNKIEDILKMASKDIAFKLLDYIEEILKNFITDEDELAELRGDIGFHSGTINSFYLVDGNINTYFNRNPGRISETRLYLAAERNINNIASIPPLLQLSIFLHLQLINDLLTYKVQNDHIYPMINRFNAKRSNIEKIFYIEEQIGFWDDKNCVVINLHDVNLEMRKTIPLLIAKNLYVSHKMEENQKSLNIIIDEAHNILSKTSFREKDEWKDYRLETFEEIIKEGRKFGVFLTISSQRPNDISETIISQAHNYFIHQLINDRDLISIGNAVSYIDKVTEESIPTLPVGTCIFSGIASPMPLKLHVYELADDEKPNSNTLEFNEEFIRNSLSD